MRCRFSTTPHSLLMVVSSCNPGCFHWKDPRCTAGREMLFYICFDVFSVQGCYYNWWKSDEMGIATQLDVSYVPVSRPLIVFRQDVWDPLNLLEKAKMCEVHIGWWSIQKATFLQFTLNSHLHLDSVHSVIMPNHIQKFIQLSFSHSSRR